ncbi:MAG TPA: hypothetical protein VKE96_19565 [Vicinamibacterales bacterium]|nr:hypothetical protein [Vicinamibacterales bacterium]
MTRRAAFILFALALNATIVFGQDTVLTINVPSADVYKGPSNIYPVVGRVSRGAVLHVSRNLGSWVIVAWPGAPDGVGYVHITAGRLSAATAAAAAAPAGNVSSQPASSVPPASAKVAPPAMRAPAAERLPARRPVAAMPESHLLGVGGLIGSMSTLGVTARAWHANRLGIQVGFTRDALPSDVAPGRVTSMQLEPGVIYSLFDRVSDYVWIRPYVGSAVSFRHQTLSGVPGGIETAESGVGFRLFGGGELTFASAPRLGVSVDVGYRRFPTPFPGFEPDPLSASIAGHWYIK